MPVVKCNRWNEDMPKWSLVREIEHHTIPVGQTMTFNSKYPKSAVYINYGCALVVAGEEETVLKSGSVKAEDRAGAMATLLDTGKFSIKCNPVPGYWIDRVDFYVYFGDWTWVKLGNFRVDQYIQPENIGDPVDYPRNTSFDNHYHEYDECWTVLRGSGIVQTEGNLVEVYPGDIVATERGEHHDFPIVYQALKCFCIKSRLGGEGRPGFLWEHTHGKPHIKE